MGAGVRDGLILIAIGAGLALATPSLAQDGNLQALAAELRQAQVEIETQRGLYAECKANLEDNDARMADWRDSNKKVSIIAQQAEREALQYSEQLGQCQEDAETRIRDLQRQLEEERLKNLTISGQLVELSGLVGDCGGPPSLPLPVRVQNCLDAAGDTSSLESEMRRVRTELGNCRDDYDKQGILISDLRGSAAQCSDRLEEVSNQNVDLSAELAACRDAQGGLVPRKKLEISQTALQQCLTESEQAVTELQTQLSECQGALPGQSCEIRITNFIGPLGPCGPLDLQQTDERLIVTGAVSARAERDAVLANLAQAYPDLQIDETGLVVQPECRAPIPGTDLFVDMNSLGAVLKTKSNVADRPSLFGRMECRRIGALLDITSDDDLPVHREVLRRFWVKGDGDEPVKCERDGGVWQSEVSGTSSSDRLAIIRIERN